MGAMVGAELMTTGNSQIIIGYIQIRELANQELR
jgi:hypothetical protein